MLLGKIVGKCTTTQFEFLATADVKKFEYCQVYHGEYKEVLAQVVELEKTQGKVLARCMVIGYPDEQGKIRQIRSPFDIGSEVLLADIDFVKSVIELDQDERGAYIGHLEGKDLKVFLDLNNLLTKHVSVLAKSGSGKSYTVSVLLEEIMDKKVPLLVIDPHGEYSSLKYPNDSEEDKNIMPRFGISAKGYIDNVQEYGDMSVVKGARPILLNESLSTEELVEMLPAKLSNNQIGLLYSVIKDMEELTFPNLIYMLEQSENPQKWNIINLLDYMTKLRLFSNTPTPYNELIQSGKCSILNLKGYSPEIQEIIVYKLLKDLFAQRKEGKIPPFFLVVEEAHNFVPERGYSDAICSKIIKTIASEGRKFGLGLCVVSQRPAIVQKTVLSQCTTQIILKITNPNDLKTVSNSVEGLTYETEQEIRNLSVGTALITGIVDMPIFVNVRPRKSKHGGTAVDMLAIDQEDKFFEEIKEFDEQEILPLIVPRTTKDDIKLASMNAEELKTNLVPCMLFLCEEKGTDFNLLVNMLNGEIVTDIESGVQSKLLPELDKLSQQELALLQAAFKTKQATASELIQQAGQNLDAQETIRGLVNKRYLSEQENQVSISERYILSNLSKHNFPYKIQFVKKQYDEKGVASEDLDEVKEKLSKFTTVKDQRECFVVEYAS